MNRISILVFALLFISLNLQADALPPIASTPPFKKVMVIIFENTNYADVMQQPFFAQLAKRGALLTNLFAEEHPSQANYIALTSGDTQGVSGDGTYDLKSTNIVDLLEAKGKTWRGYAESYPGHCALDTYFGTYARKHMPLISYTNIQNNPKRCANIVDGSQLMTDIKNDQIPDYSLYIPDMDNDGHDTSVAFADRWFSKTFGPLLQDPKFMKDMLVIVTFDESSFFSDNHIYTVLYGDGVVAGSTSNIKYDHYSLLRLIEDTMELGTFKLKDAKAIPITTVWKETTSPAPVAFE